MRDGIRFFKLFLVIGREMQLKRFHERRHDPFKKWKITDIDLAAINKWDDYSEAQREMFRFTNTTISPWTVIYGQRPAPRTAGGDPRGAVGDPDYDGKDEGAVGTPDPLIVGSGPEFFAAD